MSLDEKWNQIISNKLVTRNKEEALSLSRHPPDTLDWSPRDREGLSTKERHLYWRVRTNTRQYKCLSLDVYTSTQRTDSSLSILNITPSEQTNNNLIDSPVPTTEKKWTAP
jgi:hypothetical protein